MAINYAEFYTAASKYTDAKGMTFLTSGLGDMLIWASKNGNYGFAKCSFGKDKLVTIRLTRNAVSDGKRIAFTPQALDIVPPPEHAVLPEVTEAQRKENSRRLAYEDSVRNSYTSTFYNAETAQKAAVENQLPADRVTDFLVKSRGNHAVILNFLIKHKDQLDRTCELLKSLSDKDLRDMQSNILEDN